jgi:hypothetical protein
MPFILSDGTKKNSFGFRVRTAGIDTLRFMANPVMLADHYSGIDGILGRWSDIKLNDLTLSAEPEFNEDDDKAVKVKGMVDKGFLKGASIGISYDPDDIELMPDGCYELTKCELLEASITAIPSNANALRLYAKNSTKPLSGKQIKLSLLKLEQHSPQQSSMKKILLSMAMLNALSLTGQSSTDGVDADVFEKKINDLVADAAKSKADLSAKDTELSGVKTALDALQAQATAQKKLTVTQLVDDAIAAGKIQATEKDAWLSLAESNPELATKTLSSLSGRRTLGTQVNNPPPVADMTAEVFCKLSVAEQMKFKIQHPDAYKKFIDGLSASSPQSVKA